MNFCIKFRTLFPKQNSFYLEIPEHIPYSALSINVANNKITAVKAMQFKNNPNLEEIRLDENEIYDIANTVRFF